MSKLLIQVFLAGVLYLSTETFASVDTPSDDSDLTKSILDETPTPVVSHYFSNVDDDDEQSSVKSESRYSDIYGQTQAEQLDDKLSVLDVVLRKRRTEPLKPEEKVFDIPQADKLPIKHDVSEYILSSSPSGVQEDKKEKDTTGERAQVHPITFKLTSSSNHNDNITYDKQLDDDKTKGETVKIILNPLDRVTS